MKHLDPEKRLGELHRRLEKLLKLPVVVGNKALFHQLRMAYTRSLPRYAAERAALPDVVRQLFEHGGAEAVFSVDQGNALGLYVVVREFNDRIYATIAKIQYGLGDATSDLDLVFLVRASQGRDPRHCVPPDAIRIKQRTPRKKTR